MLLQFTSYFRNNLQRLEDSVFSPDKRSMDAERASLRKDAQPKRKRAEYAGLKAPYESGVNSILIPNKRFV